MYLTVKTVKGKKYLFLCESYRDPQTGKGKTRLIKSYGRYDLLDDKVRKAYEDEQARKLMANKLEAEARKEILSAAVSVINNNNNNTLDGEIFNKDSIDVDIPSKANGAFLLSYGHLALKPIWEKELDLKNKITQLQNYYTNIDSWKINDLIFYLTSIKLLNPQSYLQSSINRSDFIYCPWSNVSQDNFYRTLDFVYEHKDKLLKHAVKSYMKNRGKKIRVAFFDCTNTWFETPYDDVTWRAIKFAKNVREKMLKEGHSNSEVNLFMETEEYKVALHNELESGQDSDLRMRGMSKEGRFAQPLISVALAIDEEGFPIDCRVFAGNVSEIHQVEPVIQSLQEKYGLKDFYFVADRGINGTEVLNKIQEKDIGFVVAQKVSQQTEAVRKEMLDLSGYRNYQPGDDGAFVMGEEHELAINAHRFKVCDYVKKTRVKDDVDPKTGKAKTRVINVPCKIIYTFSPERKARDLAQLEELKIKAQKAVQEGALIGASLSGWRSLVETKRTQATAKTKGHKVADREEKENFRAIGLKEDVIKNKEAIAGYAAVIYAHPNNGEEALLSDTEVLDTYHKLVGIEENFRVMKNSFNIRPVYVRLHQRIEAHCYLCIFALMMLRRIQSKLFEQGTRMSAKRICEALAAAQVMISKVSKSDVHFINCRGKSNFYSPNIIGKGRLQENINDLIDQQEVFNKFVQNGELMVGDTQTILNAVGLGEVPLHVSLKQLKNILKINNCNDRQILSYEHLKMAKLSSSL